MDAQSYNLKEEGERENRYRAERKQQYHLSPARSKIFETERYLTKRKDNKGMSQKPP